ncbi:MAG TPA: SIS domain-containing protein [Nocardioidaceae bacterium]|jgi:glucosamine--fructose-6-phosphate aminotransferase (isomerizing)
MSAGEHMAAEIAEQPDVWQRLLDGSPDRLIAVARRIQESRPRFVLLTARGTSDHAALYAKYLVEIVLGLPAGLVSPSTTTVYGARPDLRDVLLLAISQSGGSPDLVQTVEAARTAGALTVAVTNNPGSALDGAAELHLDVEAGVERAVAATKSYTAELLMLYLLVATVAERERTAVRRLPDWGSRVLAEEPRVSALSKRLHPLERLMVTGRGYAYATAREAALKLMETCYISAQAFSGADLMHGPLALVEAEIPILAVTSAGKGGVALRPTLQKLHDAGGRVFCVGSFGLTEGALPDVPLPREVPEEIAPMLEILPFQQLSLSLALARGVDPDAPRGLSKVTETL